MQLDTSVNEANRAAQQIIIEDGDTPMKVKNRGDLVNSGETMIANSQKKMGSGS